MKEAIMWQISENKTWAYLERTFDWVQVMQDVPQDARHHAEGNVAVHTQLVLQQLEQLPAYQELPAQEQEILWAAALLHDVEKYSTTVIEPDGTITSAGHARKGAMKARQILYRDIVTPFHIREQIVALVRYHGLPLWVFDKPDPQKAAIAASLEVDTRLLALLARADALGRICSDQADLLYRLDCFEELCRDMQCWGQPRAFASAHARMHYLLRSDSAPDYVPFEQPAFRVIIMSGLPGAGKDTYVRRHYPQLPVISLDDIRREMKISPTDKSGNGTVIQAAKEKARVYLRDKRAFVWNATNITRQMREQLISLLLIYEAAVTIVYVEVPASLLLQQNRQREAVVPALAMERLISKLEVPVSTEAHEVVYVVPE
ncbi:AAA family ATPase [Chitinophaga nivalis]|uniref:AAA family ATPase n=1 Tax=Chitinophaga nivalis TaxID=2991709 RepID=A0ABT3IQ34_9BACT|nr:AAA family ATPase [Chitinophaga nivalis]MCW3464271.1 AAA family ATPase [Chitinophaga nivalis]MCW3486038.1 AAA family ATPase [Chitinophaga nivalis]